MIFPKKKYLVTISISLLLGFLIRCADPLPIRSLSKAKEEISRAKELGADKQAQPEYEEAKKGLEDLKTIANYQRPSDLSGLTPHISLADYSNLIFNYLVNDKPGDYMLTLFLFKQGFY